MTTQTVIDRREASDVTAVHGLLPDLSWRSVQVSPGVVHATYERLALPDVVVVRSVESHARIDEYGLPEDVVGITLPAPEGQTFRWCGHALTGEHVLLSPRAGRYMFALPPGHRSIDVLIRSRLLRDAGLRSDDWLDPSDTATWIRPMRGAGGHLYRLLSGLLDAKLAGSGWSLSGEDPEHLRETLVLGVVELLQAPNSDRDRPPSQSCRYALARRAHETIVENLHAPWSTRHLGAKLGVSVRTLQMAFREAFGVPPHEYAVAQRLQSVRECLRDPGDHGEPIRAVAARHGFTEPGRFSGLYRTMFGELPSETLTG